MCDVYGMGYPNGYDAATVMALISGKVVSMDVHPKRFGRRIDCR
ncbi:hypothetical protein [Sporosarcina phage Lietuvens]|nr:hypothetical protein [Sporosarcina phage Lietuvens]